MLLIPIQPGHEIKCLAGVDVVNIRADNSTGVHGTINKPPLDTFAHIRWPVICGGNLRDVISGDLGPYEVEKKSAEKKSAYFVVIYTMMAHILVLRTFSPGTKIYFIFKSR